MGSINKLKVLFLLLVTAGTVNATLPVQFRTEKQAMSTPMSVLEEMLFTNYFYTKPVNVSFDGIRLNLFYDNGKSFATKDLTKVEEQKLTDDEQLVQNITYYVDNKNANDTITYVVDHVAGYVQLVLPTTNSKGEYIGYTSYRQFINVDQVASK
jgi:hypothetical protein